MSFKTRYPRFKEGFLNDNALGEENRALFQKYFVWQERKLQSINGIRELDEACYKTLYHYISMFKNVVKWFHYKPLQDLTAEEIKQVYEDLEDGRILNMRGKPFEDRASYYSKVFKGKLFKMIGKYEIASTIFEFAKPEKNKGNVRFFRQKDYERMSLVTAKLSHKLMLQLCWDIGENIMTILKLQKKDCRRIINSETQEPEYIINLPQEKIKRSRTARSEITNFPETVELLDLHFQHGKKKFIPTYPNTALPSASNSGKKRCRPAGQWQVFPYEDDDYLFDFGQKQAEQIFRRVVDKTGVKCQPNGDRPTLKDLRSSMACHLLQQGWSIEEVKGRMGHKPSSAAIDRYVTYLALDKHQAKRRMQESIVKQYQKELEESKCRERSQRQWIENQKAENYQERIEQLEYDKKQTNQQVLQLKVLMQQYLVKLSQQEAQQRLL